MKILLESLSMTTVEKLLIHDDDLYIIFPIHNNNILLSPDLFRRCIIFTL